MEPLPASLTPVLDWLKINPNWLLILDNVDSEKSVEAAEQLLTHLDQGHVLITSRQERWSGAVHQQKLEFLDPEPARDYLLTATNMDPSPGNQQSAAALAKDLGYLVLALVHAAHFIRAERLTLAAYHDRWRTRQDGVLSWFDESRMKYHHSLATTYETTMEQIRPEGKALMRILAWLAPEPLPRDLVPTRCPERILSQAVRMLKTDHEPKNVVGALNDLADYSMVQFVHVPEDKNNTYFTVHPVVQHVFRERMRHRNEHQSWLEMVLKVIDGTLEEVDAAASPDKLDTVSSKPLLPHIAAVVNHADNEKVAPTSRLLNELGEFSRLQENHEQARVYFSRGLEVAELANDPSWVPIYLSKLASLSIEMGRFDDDLCRRALAALQ